MERKGQKWRGEVLELAASTQGKLDPVRSGQLSRVLARQQLGRHECPLRILDGLQRRRQGDDHDGSVGVATDEGAQVAGNAPDGWGDPLAVGPVDGDASARDRGPSK